MSGLPSGCVISSNYTSCPAGFNFRIAGEQRRLNAELTCPNELATDLDSFRAATQLGLCECTETRLLPDDTPMNCRCYGCPEGSMFASGYICDTPIVSTCVSLTCGGACNGIPDYEAFLPEIVLPAPTDAPLVAPVDATSAPSSFETNSTEDTPPLIDIADDPCDIVGGVHVCNADVDLDPQGWPAFLQAELLCPVDQVALEGGILEASHRGLCTCQTERLLIGRSQIDDDPIDCTCYVCPPGSAIKHAYACDQTIVDDCSVISCDGVCNGPLDFLPETLEPEGVPPSEAIRYNLVSAARIFALLTWQML